MKAVQPTSVPDLLDVEPPAFLRRTQGRETFAWGEDMVVKRTWERARSGLWPWFPARSAGEREHDALRALAAAGVSVPRAIGCAEERRSGGRFSVCVMERVPHELTLKDALERAGAHERRALERRLLALVVRFHENGFIHRDFYLHHVLVRASDGELVLIDVGRVRRRSAWRRRWYVKDLAALLCSAPRSVGEREKLAFLVRWLRGRGITARGAKRRLLRAVERKARRMAAHVPRDEREVRR